MCKTKRLFLSVGVVRPDQRGRPDRGQADRAERRRPPQGPARVREGPGGGGTAQESQTQKHCGVSRFCHSLHAVQAERSTHLLRSFSVSLWSEM